MSKGINLMSYFFGFFHSLITWVARLVSIPGFYVNILCSTKGEDHYPFLPVFILVHLLVSSFLIYNIDIFSIFYVVVAFMGSFIFDLVSAPFLYLASFFMSSYSYDGFSLDFGILLMGSDSSVANLAYTIRSLGGGGGFLFFLFNYLFSGFFWFTVIGFWVGYWFIYIPFVQSDFFGHKARVIPYYSRAEVLVYNRDRAAFRIPGFTNSNSHSK